MEMNLDFLEYQQRVNDFLAETVPTTMLRHIFKFIHKNFNKLNQTIQMCDVLPILHHSIRLELQTGNSIHVGAYIHALLNDKDNIKNDDTLQRCLQVLFQIQETLSTEDTQYIQIGNEVFYQLIEVLLNARSTSNNGRILACLDLHVKKFNGVEVLTHLWNSIKGTVNSNLVVENSVLPQIFIHFFDEFSTHISGFQKFIKFAQLISRLLDSNHQENRKCAYFLLRKAHLTMEEQMKSHGTAEQEHDLTGTNKFWDICITNFENLKENDFHLILPSLEQLKNLNIADLTEQIWLNMLYREILRHNNELVRRWILEYLIGNLTYSTMTSEIQIEFMRALNDTSLYNVEGYMLPETHIHKFLQCNQSTFLWALSEIEWEAVPLHFWLTQLVSIWKTVNKEDIPEEALMNLAKKIRTMQYVRIRRRNIKLFKKLFSEKIDDMNLTKYVQLIEALHNVSDFYDEINEFCTKLKECEERDVDGNAIFTLRFLQILTNLHYVAHEMFRTLFEAVKEKVDAYNWTLGSLRLIAILHSGADEELLHSDSDEENKFCEAHFGISRSSIQRETPLYEIYEKFYEKLATNDEERNYVKLHVTDMYVRQCISSYTDFENSEVRPEELVSAGSEWTLIRITSLLSEYTTFIGAETFKFYVDKLREIYSAGTNMAYLCDKLLKHCERSREEGACLEHCVATILELYPHSRYRVTKYINYTPFSDDVLIKGALSDNAIVEYPRIEEAYYSKIMTSQSFQFVVRKRYTEFICSISDNKRKAEVLRTLFERIRELSPRGSSYLENSKEHRFITRILFIVFGLLPKTDINSERISELWQFLLERNNQQNVAILYEILIATTSSWVKVFNKATELLQASTCTPNQELSIIAILYQNHKLKCDFGDKVEFEKLILLLWPLTMGIHVEARLYAQLAISDLLDKYNTKHSSPQAAFSSLHATLKKTLRDEQFTKFREDIRFMDITINDAFGEVMDFTNAPYDEYDYIHYTRFQCKREEITEQNKIEMQSYDGVVGNVDLQRKMNLVTNLMALPDLYSYPDCRENMGSTELAMNKSNVEDFH